MPAYAPTLESTCTIMLDIMPAHAPTLESAIKFDIMPA